MPDPVLTAEQEVDFVRQYRDASIPTAAILERFDLTPRQAYHVAEKHGLRRVRSARPWTDEEDQALLQMNRQGLRASAIARHLGRTPGAVHVRIHRLKAPLRRWWGSEESRQLLHGVDRLAEMFGRTPTAILQKAITLDRERRNGKRQRQRKPRPTRENRQEFEMSLMEAVAELMSERDAQ